jgi:hypothetical protein
MKCSLAFAAAISVVIISGCVETEPVSIIPEITFNKFELYYIIADSTDFNDKKLIGLLEFKFIDGDADIGIPEDIANDSTLPDSIRFNVFMFPFEKVNGSYIPIPFDTSIFPPPFFIIKYDEKLNRVGQNKTIKGIIRLDMFDLPVGYDTIRYDFFIKDRAGNKSNIESTTDIGF